MRLQTRFFLMLALLMLVMLGALGLADYQRLRHTVHDQALQEARDIRGILMATRRVYLRQFLSSGIPLNEKTLGFLPAHALGRIADDFLHWSDSGLQFNNVSDRPRNPANAADEVELQAMEFFRRNPEEKERIVYISRQRSARARPEACQTDPGGNDCDTTPYYHYSQPIWIEQYCLQCHGRRENAPAAIRERYTTAYDYQVGDLRGLLSIKLPADRLEASIWQHWKNDMLLFIPLLLGAWGAIAWWFRRLFLSRLEILGQAARRIGEGDTSTRVALPGQDELSALGRAFDRMAEEVAHREAALQRQKRLYQTLSETNQLILRLEEPERLYAEVCRIAVTYGGFQLAWIGLPQDGRGWLPAIASAGSAIGYLDALQELAGDDGSLPGPDSPLLTRGTPIIHNDLKHKKADHPGHRLALDHGLRSSALFPLIIRDEVIGIFALYAGEADFFSSDLTRLLGEMTRDIAFAQENFERERERLAFHAQVEYLTRFDRLTGLPNRSHLLSRLSICLARGQRNRQWSALLHIDLDRFKRINDSLGNSIGDDLLEQIAAIIGQQINPEDSVARLGSDEFLVLLESLATQPEAAAERARALAEQLRSHLDRNYSVQGHQVHLQASIGLVLFQNDGISPETLLQQAGAAVHQAKQDGRNCVRRFSSEMHSMVQEHLVMEQALHKALEAQQFRLFYQPQTNARGELVGAEALLRWQHPEKGLVPPGRFIPLLEESGLILEVGKWVLEEAARQTGLWHRLGYCSDQFRVAVNVSPHQFAQSGCVRQLQQQMEDARIAPQQIELEITESALLMEEADAADKIRQIQQMGVRVAIDDFGTGYSSLSRLARLPVNTIKIDLAFVRRMLDDPPSGAIVESIIDIGRRFELDIVAEGVENEAQLQFLQQRDCDYYQGFLFDRPLPAEEFLRRWLGSAPSDTI